MKKKWFQTLGLLFCCVLLSNCNKSIPPGDYDASEVGKIKKVVPGTILSIRPVRLHSKNDNLNAPIDMGSTHGSGQSIQRNHGFEYVIRLNSGSIISVVQSENIKLKNKQRILVIYGAHTRVVPDNGSDDY